MSLPSDNEGFKKEEEAFSNKDGSSDESERTTPERRKKRKTKTALKSAGIQETKPETSNTSKTGKNGNEPEDVELSEDNSSSNSGDKKVGDVREDIEQLKLTEEKAKNSEVKALEPSAQHQVGPSTSRLPQQRDSGIKRTEEVQPPTEDVSDLYDEECAPLIPDADRKRTAFARNTANTLDDVADIVPDTCDSHADSSPGKKERFHLAREETAKDDAEESCHPSDETGDCSSNSEFGSVKSVVGGKCENSSLQEESLITQSNSEDPIASTLYLYEELEKSQSDRMDKDDVSDEKDNVSDEKDNVSDEKDNVLDDKLNLTSGSGMEASGGLDQIDEKNGISDVQKNGDEQQQEVDLENREVHEEMDDSVSEQDNSSVQRSSDGQLSGIEQMSDQDGSSRQAASEDPSILFEVPEVEQIEVPEVEQIEVPEVEQIEVPEREESSERSSRESDGQFIHNESPTPPSLDSGFDSVNVSQHHNQPIQMDPRYEVQEALESHSESSFNSTELADLNSYQGWFPSPVGACGYDPEAGPSGYNPQAVPLVAPNQTAPANAGPKLDQPSTSADWPEQGTVHLAKQQFLNIPMESAEEFESQNQSLPLPEQSQGGEFRLEGALGQRPISTGADLGREGSLDDSENSDVNQVDKELLKKQTSLDQKTCRRLSRDDSSSMERSREGSLADMDDAVDTSSKSDDVQLPDNRQLSSGVFTSDQRPLMLPPPDNLTRPSEGLRSDARPLVLEETKRTAGCSKPIIPKKPSQKRIAKTTVERKLKKKRKGPPTCRQAQLNEETLMETSSEEEYDS